MDITLQAGQAQALRCKAPQGKGRAQKSEPGGGRSKQCLQNRKITQRKCHQHVSFGFRRIIMSPADISISSPVRVPRREFLLELSLCYTQCYLALEQLENSEQKATTDMFQPDFMVFDRKVRQGVSKTIVCRCGTQAQHYTVLGALEHFLTLRKSFIFPRLLSPSLL